MKYYFGERYTLQMSFFFLYMFYFSLPCVPLGAPYCNTAACELSFTKKKTHLKTLCHEHDNKVDREGADLFRVCFLSDLFKPLDRPGFLSQECRKKENARQWALQIESRGTSQDKMEGKKNGKRMPDLHVSCLSFLPPEFM